jgi:hypothetical protein
MLFAWNPAGAMDSGSPNVSFRKSSSLNLKHSLAGALPHVLNDQQAPSKESVIKGQE